MAIAIVCVQLAGRGQDTSPPRKATQAEVNSGASVRAFVAPDTLLQPTHNPHYSYTDANATNIDYQVQQWGLANTNNSFATPWTGSNALNGINGTNGWTLHDHYTNGAGQIFYGAGGGVGVSGYPLVLSNNAVLRCVTSITVPSGGINSGTFIIIGPGTNNSGVIDQTTTFGFGVWNGVASWDVRQGRWLHAPATSVASWGTSFVTNLTYYLCFSKDARTYNFTVTWPGWTNEFRMMAPITNGYSLATVASNVCLWLVSNNNTNGPKFNAIGGRIGGQTITPRTGIEGNAPYVHWTFDTNNDLIRIAAPANYDTGTNPAAGAILYFGGNGETELEPFDGQDIEGGHTPTVYHNAFVQSNYILISFGPNGALDNTGRKLTWGTSNSLVAANAALAAAKEIGYSWSNLFVYGSSAGFFSALNFTRSNHSAVCGLLGNHAAGPSLTNYWPGRADDITNAYGGGIGPSVFAGYDPGTYPLTYLRGIPVSITSSTNDNVVNPTNNTDPLVIALGGTLGADVFNTSFCPEVRDVKVGGTVGHGTSALWADPAGDVAFMRRCAAYRVP